MDDKNNLRTKHNSKLERNVVKIRHRWNRTDKQCDCGCKEKIWVNSHWVCLWKLNEILREHGYKVKRVDF